MQGADGSWSVPRDAPARRCVPGVRRLLRSPASRETLAGDLAGRRRGPLAPLPAPATSVDVDGLRVGCPTGEHAGRLRASPSTRARRRPVASRTTWAPRATSSRCARATSRSCTCIPDEHSLRFTATFPTRGPLPPVPAVPDRRPRAHRRLHPGGLPMTVATEHLELPITGMTCASCANRVERGSTSSTASPPPSTTRRRRRRSSTTRRAVAPEQLVEARSQAAGYAAQLPAADRRGREAAEEDAAAPLRRAAARSPPLLSLPVLLISMIPALQFDNWQWLSLNLATPVVLWGALAVPPRRVGQPPARRRRRWTRSSRVGMLAAWLWSLYALFIGDAGMNDMRMEFDLIPSSGRGRRRDLPRDRRDRHDVHPRRPLLRGARQAARRRRAEGAARAGRQGRRRPRRRRQRAPRPDRAARRSATASSSAPARRSPPTASSRRARPPST